MTQSMLMFSLGPVQSFIAQARKTRDLWLGSFLLSTLMEAAMEGTPGEFVFPSKRTIEGNIPDLPNKYIAIFATSGDAKKAVMLSQDRVGKQWHKIQEEVRKEVISGNIKSKDRDVAEKIWQRQVAPGTLFEVFWVVVERQANENYGDWLKRTQEAFDARKRLRDFTLPVSASETSNGETGAYESGEKSTISGEREALHGIGKSRKDVREFWQKVAQKQSVYVLNKDGEERLDAIDTIKRFAAFSTEIKNILAKQQESLKHQKESEVYYPSTSSIATANFVESLLEHDITMAALREWLDATDGIAEMSPDTIPFLYELARKQPEKAKILKRDGDCYFPETFTAYRLKKDYNYEKADRKADEGRRALQTLLRETDKANITRPTPYYAMIQMDGDHMGTLIGDVKEQSEHTAISKALSDFSREEAPKVVEHEYPGRLIYAGGDDVFALAPLARDIPSGEEHKIGTVLNLVGQLQQQYCNRVKGAVELERQAKVSASIGIAIAHHFTSLSFVRRSSKEAEDLAKNHYGRNALVVTVLRRSGEQTRVGCHWKYEGLEDEAQPIRLFKSFYELFKKDVLSPKCVYTLLEEAPILVHLDQAAQQSEVKRVLLRQRDKDKEKEHYKEEEGYVVKQAKNLVELANAMDNAKIDFELQGNKDPQDIEDLKKKWTTELPSTKWRYG
ncbi:MAG: type III-B CRISPR-associated protein Cas10/Cmr2, partial [Ktedonobacteraceae bacterium]